MLTIIRISKFNYLSLLLLVKKESLWFYTHGYVKISITSEICVRILNSMGHQQHIFHPQVNSRLLAPVEVTSSVYNSFAGVKDTWPSHRPISWPFPLKPGLVLIWVFFVSAWTFSFPVCRKYTDNFRWLIILHHTDEIPLQSWKGCNTWGGSVEIMLYQKCEMPFYKYILRP